MSYLMVDGVEVKTPSSFNPKRFDLSAPDSGRDLTGLMYANKLKDSNGNIVTKTTIDIVWSMCTPAETKAILDAFEASEYFDVTYYDPKNANTQVTKTFYVGDRDIPVKQWYVGGRYYDHVSCTIIER